MLNIQRITYKILILTFKVYHKTAPQYICDLIIARTYNRAVRSNNSFALVVPMIKLKHYGDDLLVMQHLLSEIN